MASFNVLTLARERNKEAIDGVGGSGSLFFMRSQSGIAEHSKWLNAETDAECRSSRAALRVWNNCRSKHWTAAVLIADRKASLCRSTL